MAPIPNTIIDEVRFQTDIVDVISRYVKLKQSGLRWMGLCPFHQEKTPSFQVHQGQQFYYCFGCHKSGNVFGFLMEHDHVTFVEAVERLAKEAGIEVPQVATAGERSELERLRGHLDWAAGLFGEWLHGPNGQPGRDYLARRTVDAEMERVFSIGYAPEGWDRLTQLALHEKRPLGDLERLGLIKRREDGGYYDAFRHRIIFPIRDLSDRIVGFGGRALEEGEKIPKYLNSPESVLYHKGTLLYGLNLARGQLNKRPYLLVVEGFMDVIACHQNGFGTAIASQGTAFTPDQARLLCRFTEDVRILFDADSAGAAATRRSLEILLEQGIFPRVVTLTDAKDPDEYLKKFGPEAFAARIDAAGDWFVQTLEDYTKKVDMTSPSQRKNAVLRITPLLGKVRNEAMLGVMLSTVADRLGINQQELRREVAKNRSRPAETQAPAQARSADEEHELTFCGLLFYEPKLIPQIKDALTADEFQYHGELYRRILDLFSQGITISPGSASDNLTPAHAALLGEIFAKLGAYETYHTMGKDYYRRLKKRSIQRQLAELTRQMRELESRGGPELEFYVALAAQLHRDLGALLEEES